jgi:hypothetical protein
MKASAKTKGLMQELRKATTEIAQKASSHTGMWDWTRTSEARADIVEYIGKLEALLKRQQDSALTAAEMSYTPRWEDLTFQSKFRPRRYQKDAMHFIRHYSHGGKMTDFMQQFRNGTFDFGNHEARVLAYYANGKGKSFIDFESLYVAPPLKVTPFSVEGIA